MTTEGHDPDETRELFGPEQNDELFGPEEDIEGPVPDETVEQPALNGSDEPPPPPQRNTLAIVLGVAVVILLGAVLGYVVSGGLGDDPVAGSTSTTLSTTPTTVAVTTPTTVPTSTGPTVATTEATDTSVGASTTAAPAPPLTEPEGERTLAAAEDTYIDTSDPTEVNGDETSLEIEDDPSQIKQALVRFDIPEIPDDVILTEAIMRFTIITPGTSPVAVHEVIGTWSEADTNAENAPLLGDLVTIIETPEPGATFVEVDMVDRITEAGPVSFYLVIDSPDQEEDVEYSSREGGAGAPGLLLRWEP